MNFERALSESATLWQSPTRGDFGLTDARVIVPGHPSNSILNYRVSSIGSGHMPPLGPREVDGEGAKLLWEWIAGLPGPSEAEAEPVDRFDQQLLANTSSAMRLARAVAAKEIPEADRALTIEAGLASPNQNIRALFERFRPPGERPAMQTLNPANILTLRGDAENGARILSLTGKLASCFACHKLGNEGGDLGPDLTQVGARLNRDLLLESLLAPSKTIAPDYGLWTVETLTEIHTGFIVQRTGTELILKLATGQSETIPAAQVKSSKPLPVSLMPEGLLGFLTEQETADVVAWLASRR